MRSLSLLFLLVLSPTSGAGQRPPALDTTGLSAYIASMARVGQLPVVAVAVVGPKGTIYLRGGLRSRWPCRWPAPRIRGSHHIFTRERVEEILNLQPKGAKAKSYQVKQVRNVILNYRLTSHGKE